MKVWKCRTPKERDKLAAHFADLCKGWAKKVGVTHWDIDVAFKFGTEFTQEHRDILDGQAGAMTISNPTYERATIYLCALDEDSHWSQRQIVEIAAHEVVHILLSPITNTFSGEGNNFLETRTTESVVTRTSRALMGWFG